MMMIPFQVGFDTCLHSYYVTGEHQHELLDFAAAKFHEEPGVFKLLVGNWIKNTVLKKNVLGTMFF